MLFCTKKVCSPSEITKEAPHSRSQHVWVRSLIFILRVQAFRTRHSRSSGSRCLYLPPLRVHEGIPLDEMAQDGSGTQVAHKGTGSKHRHCYGYPTEKEGLLQPLFIPSLLEIDEQALLRLGLFRCGSSSNRPGRSDENQRGLEVDTFASRPCIEI